MVAEVQTILAKWLVILHFRGWNRFSLRVHVRSHARRSTSKTGLKPRLVSIKQKVKHNSDHNRVKARKFSLKFEANDSTAGLGFCSCWCPYSTKPSWLLTPEEFFHLFQKHETNVLVCWVVESARKTTSLKSRFWCENWRYLQGLLWVKCILKGSAPLNLTPNSHQTPPHTHTHTRTHTHTKVTVHQ